MNSYQKVLTLVRADPTCFLREYGEEMGVSREYVRQLLKKAKERNELPNGYNYGERAFTFKKCGNRHSFRDECSICNPLPLPPVEEAKIRFWSNVDRRDDDRCWIWSGSCHPTLKYGIFGAIALTGRYHEYAHRVSWIINRGPIPKGFCVLHHCDNPPCVNPNHLYIGTMADNMRDRDIRGRYRSGMLEKRKTHCKYGHKFTEENTSIYNGAQHCKKCDKIRYQERKSATTRD